MRVGDTLAEPLKIFEPTLSAAAREAQVAAMLDRVGLSAAMARRYPHEFSGGQCQRIGIARAMMLRPKLLICDEPVSSLDVSIQGQIVNLLVDLQKEFGIAMLFISHNLAVVRHVSHRVLVIYRGRLVEIAARDELFAAPAHPYTRALLAAVPDPTRASAGRALTTGDDPAVVPRSPTGCAFHDRCAYARGICLNTVPLPEEVRPLHAVACHRWREVVYS
jgi:oligopeptide transport system ATP-binding protein